MKNKFLIFILIFVIGILSGILLLKYINLQKTFSFLYNNPEIGSPPLLVPPKSETQTLCQEIKNGIEVSLKEQKTRICEDGKALEEFSVSTGKQDTPTPTGEFSVTYKTPVLYSKIAESWLPFWIGFHEDHGFHELPINLNGKRVGEDKIGETDSLGCIRLKIGDAEKIYQRVKIGTKIIIF
jgi:hypothetical protein